VEELEEFNQYYDLIVRSLENPLPSSNNNYFPSNLVKIGLVEKMVAINFMAATNFVEKLD